MKVSWSQSKEEPMKNRSDSQHTTNKSETQVFGDPENPSKAGMTLLLIFLPEENTFLAAGSN